MKCLVYFAYDCSIVLEDCCSLRVWVVIRYYLGVAQFFLDLVQCRLMQLFTLFISSCRGAVSAAILGENLFRYVTMTRSDRGSLALKGVEILLIASTLSTARVMPSMVRV